MPKRDIEITLRHGCSPVNLLHIFSNFIEITLQHGCSPVNLLHIFRTPFSKNTSWWLLLNVDITNTFIVLYMYVNLIMSYRKILDKFSE